MSRADLMGLALRVEAATGADRELDEAIAVTVMAMGWTPKFTASLDAAMTLVPEGMAWELYSDGSGGVGPEPDYGRLFETHHEASATSPARCLTAASLCARATMEKKEDGDGE